MVPFGDLAAQVLLPCDVHPMQETSRPWRAWIAARRARYAGRCDRLRSATLRDLRQSRDVTQEQLVSKVGMSQSDRSNAERRSDPKRRSVRALVGGLGWSSGSWWLILPREARKRPRAPWRSRP